SDKHPLRRGTAVVALGKGGFSPHPEQLHKLLLDPSPPGRLRTAPVLAQAHDSPAVSTLIALLGGLAAPQAPAPLEDFLIGLAGELGPKVRLGEDETTPAKVRDAWDKWWRDTEGTALLDELRKRTVSEADHDKIQALIRKLGDDSFQERKRANAELIR